MASLQRRAPIPFGRYVLLDRINIGGMAEVWRGRALGGRGGERPVAIKRLLPHIAEEAELVALFHEEARICAQLDHPNIARVEEHGQIGGSHYLALEYVAGQDARALFQRMRKLDTRVPVPLVCHLVAELCAGLDHAHRKHGPDGRPLDIVHRDVSPQNVLLSYAGEVKVIDFGIAKCAGRAVLTQAGTLRGKFAYMSPERVEAQPLDRRTDIFSIGVVLHELLTGERLFQAESEEEVLERVRRADVAPPSARNPDVPPALDAIVLKSLAREVDARWAWASELGDALRRFLASTGQRVGRAELRAFLRSAFAAEVALEEAREEEEASITLPSEVLTALLEAARAEAPRQAGGGAPARRSVWERLRAFFR